MTTTYAGVVTLVGKPNVGKSTLLNRMLDAPVAPVSARPQTTRRQLRGIYSERHRQIVFVDTPGLHAPADQLDRYMDRQIKEALEDVDLILWVTDLRHPPTPEDHMVAQQLRPLLEHFPVWLIGNKLDVATRPDDAMELYRACLPEATQSRQLSALDPLATAQLRQDVLTSMPEGPWLYPEDFGQGDRVGSHSDQTPRRWAADMIRQAALERLHQEIPYAVAVKIETLETRQKTRSAGARAGASSPAVPVTVDLLYCKATLFVEREAHKPIVIGRGGNMLKLIGSRARKLLEHTWGQKVFLDLEVRVYPHWRKDKEALRELEFD